MKLELRGLDVWGNEKDGFEINDILGVIGEIDYDEERDDNEPMQAIVDLCLYGSSEIYDFEWFGDETIFGNVIHVETGKPILQVKQIEESKPKHSSLTPFFV